MSDAVSSPSGRSRVEPAPQLALLAAGDRGHAPRLLRRDAVSARGSAAPSRARGPRPRSAPRSGSERPARRRARAPGATATGRRSAAARRRRPPGRAASRKAVLRPGAAPRRPAGDRNAGPGYGASARKLPPRRQASASPTGDQGDPRDRAVREADGVEEERARDDRRAARSARSVASTRCKPKREVEDDACPAREREQREDSRTSVTSTARACAMPAQTPAITRSSARRANARQRHRHSSYGAARSAPTRPAPWASTTSTPRAPSRDVRSSALRPSSRHRSRFT